MANRRDRGGPPPELLGSGSSVQRLEDMTLRASGGTVDPFAPSDPLTKKASPRLVYRDNPIVTIQNTWSIAETRGALQAHTYGQFDASAQLCDSIIADDRVTATLGSRISGLFSREVRFRPADDSAAAKEVLDAWMAHWPLLYGDYAFPESSAYAILMGFSQNQLVWDTSGPVWTPYMRPWHARYSYYNWTLRRYMAITMDGTVPIEPGDGKWVVHAPFGEYRGWIRGAIRPIAEPWLLRHFAARDMAQFSEVHGQPTRVGETPAAADPDERNQFEDDLSNLGAASTILIAKGVDAENSYGYRLVEASDTAWEVFPGLIDRCDLAIVLAILFQNLTTEVKGGAFAATSAHMDIRQGGIQFDGAAWKNTTYRQIARPFAYFNFGDAALAPWTEWDVASRDEYSAQAQQFQAFGTAVEVLRRGGIEFEDVKELRAFAAKRFGLDGLPKFKITAPVAGGGGK